MERDHDSTESRANLTVEELAHQCAEYRRVLLSVTPYLRQEAATWSVEALCLLEDITEVLWPESDQEEGS